MASPKKKLLLYCLELFLMLFTSQLANPLTNWLEPGITRSVIRDIFLRIPIALLGFKWVHQGRMKQDSKQKINFSISYRFVLWLGVGLVLPFSVVAIYWLNGWILTPQFYPQVFKSSINLLFVALTSAIAASTIEEVLFRGYLFQSFKHEINLRSAIFIPSLLFGIIHIPTLQEFSAMNVFLITLGGTLIGIFLALVVLYTQRVESAIAIHLVWNLVFSKGLIEFYPTVNTDTNDILPLIFTTTNPLITGGSGDIQVGLPAITSYLIAIAIMGIVIKRRSVPEMLKRNY